MLRAADDGAGVSFSSLALTPVLEQLLQDRTRMLDSLLSNLDGLAYCCLCDESWTMIFVSEGCREVTGYDADDLIFNRRLSYNSLTHPDDRARVRTGIDTSIARGDRFDVEYRILHADGSVRWVWERGTTLRNEHGGVEALEGFIQDITRLKLSEQAAREAEERYRSIFENALEGIYQTSPEGSYLNFNPALARIYGYDSPEDLRQGISDIQNQLYVDHNKRNEFVAIMRAQGRVQNFEAQVYRKSGDIIWISENARQVLDADGNLLFFEGTVEDITERKNFEQQIEYQATHDGLTGLPNRSLLSDRLEQCITLAERNGTQLAVAFIDLDQFKLINDSMGHDMGDRLLVEMAKRLSDCVRESDTVVRLGGDEFVILLTNIHKVEDISHSMQRILASVSQNCTIDHRDFVVSCSIGISMYPQDGRDPNTLLKHADSAMYEAKRAGRNNLQFYTPALNDILIERLSVEYRLRQAIERKEFVLHYQPKMDFLTGKVNGAEALIRWQPEGGEMIPPVKFIPVAEETGMIEEIGAWVMREACSKAHELRERLGRDIPIAVNVSPRQFGQPHFVESVRRALASVALPPHCLELEITESTLVLDARKFVDTLHELKALGVCLAIDDFGTGYSSMAYLKDFPVDRLKIDRSFVDNLEQEPAKKPILNAIVALGRSLGLKVIAEGVETRYEHDHLRSMGCDELQGYFFSKPLTSEAFERLLIEPTVG
jgi:diguanylate cyclase (GGDEF)-like protein/PAS domain S-box-containing protein